MAVAEPPTKRVKRISPGWGAVTGPGAMMLALKKALKVLNARSLSRDYGPDLQEYVLRLEEAFCNLSGASMALGVVSGTAALKISLAALGVGPGDEVIMPCYTWISTAASAALLGARPVLAEIDSSFTVDPDSIASLVTPRTKAILPVHLLGTPCRMDAIRSIAQTRNIPILEDCAQAIGTKYRGQPVGCLGDISAFSLQFTKTITSGEGGVVCTSNPRLYERVVRLHDVGKFRENTRSKIVGAEKASEEAIFGENLRMCELRGALGVTQLQKLPNVLAPMKRMWHRLYDSLAGPVGSTPGCEFVPVNDDEGHLAQYFGLLFDCEKRRARFEEVAKTVGVNPFRVYDGRPMYWDEPVKSVGPRPPTVVMGMNAGTVPAARTFSPGIDKLAVGVRTALEAAADV